MNKKQVLYLSYDGMTDPLGQSQVLPYLIGLSKHGYSFTLISCEKKERFYQNKAAIEQICSDNNIDWQPIFYSKKPPILSTVWDVYQINRKAKNLHKKKQFQLVHCRSYIPSLIGLGLKKIYNVKFIFDMRGFWADERVDGGLWNLNHPLFKMVYNFFKTKEKEFLTHADKVISLTQSGKQEMLMWKVNGLSAEKIEVIPCAADYDLFELINQEKRTQAKLKHGLHFTQFVLGYVGSLGTWYLVDEMLLFFSVLKRKYTDAKFLFITPDDKEQLISLGKKYQLDADDFIVKFSARKDIPSIAHAFDFSIFFIETSYSKKSSSPTKMGELLAMGIPLICNSNVGDVEEIMTKTKAGFCLNTLIDSKFVEVVEQLSDWNVSTPLERREASKQYYDLKLGVKSYLAVYRQLL
ncbi:MAG: glycosyltransferase [Flavobacteriales bacterium]|nr:glycosyltransferase [Flavobacteriales bacterium]